jgi:transcriptional regulator with XRE-family HTH domain
MPSPETVGAMLAANVACLRKRRGLSFDQLAAAADLSKGTLVQIEQGSTNPNIATLCRLANVFGVTLAQLIGEPAATPVQRVALADATELWTGKKGSSARLLIGIEDKSLVEFWQWRLKPGHQHASAAHPKGTHEILFVLQGILRLSLSGQTHVVHQDEAIKIGADVPHRYENKTRSEVRFVMTVIEPRLG